MCTIDIERGPKGGSHFIHRLSTAVHNLSTGCQQLCITLFTGYPQLCITLVAVDSPSLSVAVVNDDGTHLITSSLSPCHKRFSFYFSVLFATC